MCDGGGRVGLVVELEKRVETEQRRVLLPSTRTPSALYDNVRVQEQQRVETRTAHSQTFTHLYSCRHSHWHAHSIMRSGARSGLNLVSGYSHVAFSRSFIYLFIYLEIFVKRFMEKVKKL